MDANSTFQLGRQVDMLSLCKGVGLAQAAGRVDGRYGTLSVKFFGLENSGGVGIALGV